MSLAEDVLDELCFAPAPLAVWLGPELSLQPSTLCRLPAADSPREFQFGLPYFVRNLGRTQLGGHWPGFCSLLRQHGLPVFSAVTAFHDVPAAAVPARWGRRWLNTAFDLAELETADAFEIAGCDASESAWGWSGECTPENRAGLVSAARAASGHDTPIGMSLPLNAHPSDVQSALAASVDFLTLCSRNTRLTMEELHGLVRCRQIVESSGSAPTPLLVCAPVSDHHRLHKLLALGATAVCIDDALHRVWAERSAEVNDSSGSGMLSGLLPVATSRVSPLEAIAKTLEDMRMTLKRTMQASSAQRLEEFTHHVLRSCTPRAQILTGTELLSL